MEYLLDLLLQLLPSDTAYALEDPGYHATYRALENQGRRIIPIPWTGTAWTWLPWPPPRRERPM